VSDLTSTKINFLKSIGADEKNHSGGTLLDHLIGVHKILHDLGTPEYLQDAGLFHSVYGTTQFKHQSTKDREKVRELIGEKAEELVILFSRIPQPRLGNIMSLEESPVKEDLLLLNKANEEEMYSRKRKNRMMTWEEAYNV